MKKCDIDVIPAKDCKFCPIKESCCLRATKWKYWQKMSSTLTRVVCSYELFKTAFFKSDFSAKAILCEVSLPYLLARLNQVYHVHAGVEYDIPAKKLLFELVDLLTPYSLNDWVWYWAYPWQKWTLWKAGKLNGWQDETCKIDYKFTDIIPKVEHNPLISSKTFQPLTEIYNGKKYEREHEPKEYLE